MLHIRKPESVWIRYVGHPDKDRENPKADDNFIAIAGAYQTLSDETERRNYDQLASAGPSSGPQGQITAHYLSLNTHHVELYF